MTAEHASMIPDPERLMCVWQKRATETSAVLHAGDKG